MSPPKDLVTANVSFYSALRSDVSECSSFIINTEWADPKVLRDVKVSYDPE